jgi:hypothetical protein
MDVRAIVGQGIFIVGALGPQVEENRCSDAVRP